MRNVLKNVNVGNAEAKFRLLEVLPLKLIFLSLSLHAAVALHKDYKFIESKEIQQFDNKWKASSTKLALANKFIIHKILLKSFTKKYSQNNGLLSSISNKHRHKRQLYDQESNRDRAFYPPQKNNSISPSNLALPPTTPPINFNFKMEEGDSSFMHNIDRNNHEESISEGDPYLFSTTTPTTSKTTTISTSSTASSTAATTSTAAIIVINNLWTNETEKTNITFTFQNTTSNLLSPTYQADATFNSSKNTKYLLMAILIPFALVVVVTLIVITWETMLKIKWSNHRKINAVNMQNGRTSSIPARALRSSSEFRHHDSVSSHQKSINGVSQAWSACDSNRTTLSA